MKRTFPLALILSATSIALSFANLPGAQAENWPQWRGPKFDGISNETNLPTTWSKTENVAWRLALPGPGGSTPCIWDKQIFLTSVDGNDLVLIAADTSGKL